MLRVNYGGIWCQAPSSDKSGNARHCIGKATKWRRVEGQKGGRRKLQLVVPKRQPTADKYVVSHKAGRSLTSNSREPSASHCVGQTCIQGSLEGMKCAKRNGLTSHEVYPIHPCLSQAMVKRRCGNFNFPGIYDLCQSPACPPAIVSSILQLLLWQHYGGLSHIHS